MKLFPSFDFELLASHRFLFKNDVVYIHVKCLTSNDYFLDVVFILHFISSHATCRWDLVKKPTMGQAERQGRICTHEGYDVVLPGGTFKYRVFDI